MIDVKVSAGIDEFGTHEPDPATLIGFLKAMEFAALAKRAASHFGIEDIDAIPRGDRRRKARENARRRGERDGAARATMTRWRWVRPAR